MLAALTPSSGISGEQGSVIGRLLVGLLGSLLLIAFVAYLAGRSIVSGLDPLVTAADSIAAGRLHERVPVRGTRRVRDSRARRSTRWRLSWKHGWRISRASAGASATRTPASATRSRPRSTPSSSGA